MSSVDPLLSRNRSFRSTAWSNILDARDGDREVRERALEKLVSVYWRPIYWTLRLDWSAGPEDARDLTQEYFAAFLESDLLARVAREKGRFRHYVKATLKNFMLNVRRTGASQRRGGGRRIIALDDLLEVEASPTAREEPPDRRFDRELMRSIVHESLRALEERCTEEGKKLSYDLFFVYYLERSSGRPLRYEELQERFGVGVHEVKNRLAEMRARFRRTVLEFLRDGTATEDEVMAEVREIFAT